MQFSITISGDEKELTPAVQALVSAVAKGNAAVNVDSAKSDSKPEQKSSTRKSSTKKDEPKQEPETTEEETGRSNQSAESGDDKGTEDIPSVVDLRAKAGEVGTTPEKKKKIKELLNKYDCPNVSSVPEDQRTAFMAELEKI